MAGRLQFESVRAIRDMQSNRGLGSVTLTIAGVDYPYTPGRNSYAQILGTGGFGQDVSAVFLVERSLFTVLPKTDVRVTDNKDGKKYKIVTVNDSADGAYVVLNCADLAQKI